MSITDKVIVLDLDETLLHTFEDMKDLKELNIFSDPKLLDLRRRTYIIHEFDMITARGTKGLNRKGKKSIMWGIERPHLHEFLRFCFNYFKKVAVWTAGTKPYAFAIVNKIFKDLPQPHIIYSREDCKYNNLGLYHKPLLHMINNVPNLNTVMSLNNSFIIDDRTTNFTDNPNNGITIPPYDPYPTIAHMTLDDNRLLKLKEWFLSSKVKNSTDVRKLNKKYIFIDNITNDLNIINNKINMNNIVEPVGA